MSEKTKMMQRRVANSKESSEFYQERRTEIIKKAADIFLELGYQSATIQDIAARVNMDRASLYYYAGSKQELFQNVVREATSNILQSAEKLEKADLPASQKLSVAFTELMQSFDISFPYLHVFMQENFNTVSGKRDKWSEETMKWTDRYYRAIHKIVQQGVDDGEFTLQLPVGLTTMALIGSVGWAHRWYRPSRGKLTATEVGSGFADIVLNGIMTKRKRKSANSAAK